MSEKQKPKQDEEVQQSRLETWHAKVERASEVLDKLFSVSSIPESELSEPQRLVREAVLGATQDVETFLLRESFHISEKTKNYFNFSNFADAIHDNPSQLYENENVKVDQEDVFAAFSVSPRLEAVLKELEYFTVEDVLVIIREQIISQIFAERVTEIALEMIKSMVPDFAPQTQTVVLVCPVSEGFAEDAAYDGLIDGVGNVIELDVTLDPYRNILNEEASLEFVTAISSAVHELFHARHGELINEGISEEEPALTSNGPYIDVAVQTRESFEFWCEENFGVDYTEDAIYYVEDSVSEGIALFFEIYILAQWKKQVYQETPDLVMLIQNYLNDRFEGLRQKSDSEDNNIEDFYYIGLQMMRQLMAQFSFSEVIAIIKDIDISACMTIPNDSPQAIQMQKDARLLPGLEKNVAVQKSLGLEAEE